MDNFNILMRTMNVRKNFVPQCFQARGRWEASYAATYPSSIPDDDYDKVKSSIIESFHTAKAFREVTQPKFRSFMVRASVILFILHQPKLNSDHCAQTLWKFPIRWMLLMSLIRWILHMFHIRWIWTEIHRHYLWHPDNTDVFHRINLPCFRSSER